MVINEWIINNNFVTETGLKSNYNLLMNCLFVGLKQVGEQEAVDVISGSKNLVESCKKLVDITSSRGNIDDVTVMVINLQSFVN